MCQRAHNRRHEGRAIRRERPRMARILRDLPDLSDLGRQFAELGVALLEGFAKAVAEVQESFRKFWLAFSGQPDVIVLHEVPVRAHEGFQPWLTTPLHELEVPPLKMLERSPLADS